MSLRTRFIALFTLLAVIPLVGVGIHSYLQSMRAVEELVATQVEEIGRNAARQVRDRYQVHQSNLLLLAENDETRGLYEARASGDALRVGDAMSTAEPFLDYAWQVLGDDYEWIELRGQDGRVLYRLGEDYLGEAVAGTDRAQAGGPQWLILRQAVVGVSADEDAGEVVAAVLPDAILPLEALETRFGASGYSTVLDQESGRVLYHPRHTFWQGAISEVTGPDGWGIDPDVLDEPEGTFTYREADSSRVAFFVNLTSPRWTVIASGSTDEFGAPFARTRTGNLVLILMLALVVAGAYALLARRATRSLVALTHAADRVGAGDLSPELPEEGQDEVGRLTRAFRVMVARVRESLRQMEASRQMAAVGEFASQISHEIRNPLTSMNLNLQGLRRDVESGRIPAESSKPVEICLKEVQRLDRVVTGVLDLARPPSLDLKACSLHGAIKEALEVLQEQLARKQIIAQTDFGTDSDIVRGDPEALQSMFINLFLNSAEAMEDGGSLQVSTQMMGWEGTRPGIRVTVVDSGPGIPVGDREEIFHPFFTTKKGGTGLGLSLAARIVEAHQGDLRLADPSGAASGSTFVIELPLMHGEEGT